MGAACRRAIVVAAAQRAREPGARIGPSGQIGPVFAQCLPWCSFRRPEAACNQQLATQLPLLDIHGRPYCSLGRPARLQHSGARLLGPQTAHLQTGCGGSGAQSIGGHQVRAPCHSSGPKWTQTTLDCGQKRAASGRPKRLLSLITGRPSGLFPIKLVCAPILAQNACLAPLWELRAVSASL